MPEVPKAGFIWDTSELESAGIIKIIPDPNATAISEINADPKNHVIYDMSGRRLNSINGHGIFIIDGVKIIR